MPKSRRWLFVVGSLFTGILWWSLSYLAIPNSQPSNPSQTRQIPTPKHRPNTTTPLRRLQRTTPSRPQRRRHSTPAQPRKTPPRKPNLQQGLQQLSSFLNRHTKRFGNFADGSQLIGMRNPKELQHPPPRDSEVPRGFELWRMNPRGELVRIGAGVVAHQAVIAPQTDRIAIVAEDQHLYLTGPQGQGPLQSIIDRVGFHPSFDKTGTKLAFTQRTSLDQNRLFWRNVKTGRQVLLESKASGLGQAIFHPNGRSLLFVSDRSGIVSLWKVALPNGTPQQVTNVGIQPGQGLPSHFVPPPVGPILWARDRIVYDAGDALWTLRDNGTQAKTIGPAVRWVRWLIAGESVRFAPKQGPQQTKTLP